MNDRSASLVDPPTFALQMWSHTWNRNERKKEINLASTTTTTVKSMLLARERDQD